VTAWLDLYRKHLEARLLAPSSVRHHALALSLFARWMAERDLRDATLQTLLDYHTHLAAKRRADGAQTTVTYRNRQLRIVVNFCAFLHERGKLLVDPGADFPVLHKPQRLPRGVLTHAQTLRLLAQPNTQTLLGYRDHTILETLYSCGLRALELCRLTIYDLDLSARTLRVLRGKGGKDRLVPIGATAANYVREYLAQVRPLLLARSRAKSDVDRLFLNQQGRALDTNALRRLVRRHARAADLPATTTPHSLRHACATEMLRGGASVRHVQELLGHSHLTTTQIYTRVVPVDLQRVHTATAPSERRRKLDAPTFDLRGFRDQKNHARFYKRRTT
jgi:integrase/recombinase XerD